MRMFASVFLIVVLLLSGCASLLDERRKTAMREHTELEGLKAEMRRLKTLVDESEGGRQALYNEIEDLQASIRNIENYNVKLRNALSKMQTSFKASEAVHRKMRDEIIEDLSRKIKKVMRLQSSQARRVESGYEHVVRAGETLSEIASAYNSRVSVIVKVNKLKNPNAIREGQKLFIPE